MTERIEYRGFTIIRIWKTHTLFGIKKRFFGKWNIETLASSYRHQMSTWPHRGQVTWPRWAQRSYRSSDELKDKIDEFVFVPEMINKIVEEHNIQLDI